MLRRHFLDITIKISGAEFFSILGNKKRRLKKMLINLLNEQRAAHNLHPFKPDRRLDLTSHEWAIKLDSTRNFTHGNWFERLRRIFPNQNIQISENIAMADSEEQAVSMWMQSPGHRAAILGDYTHVGVGIQGSYYCTDFARLSPDEEEVIEPEFHII